MEISATLLTFVILVSATFITFIAAILLAVAADEDNGETSGGVSFMAAIMFILTVVYAFVTGIIRITV